MKKQEEVLRNLSKSLQDMAKNYKQHELFYGKKPTSLTSPDYKETLKCMEQLQKLTR